MLQSFLNWFRKKKVEPPQRGTVTLSRVEVDDVEREYRKSRAVVSIGGTVPLSDAARAQRSVHYVTEAQRGERGYAAAQPSRNFPWSGSSGDGWQELRQDRPALVTRALQMSRDVSIYRRAIDVLCQYVVGPTGFALKSDVRNADGSPDAFAQGVIERGWRRFTSGPVTLDGKHDFVSFLRAAYSSMQVTGEVFVRKIVRENGDLRLQLIESPCVPDRLDRDISSEPTYTRAGLVFDRKTHELVAVEVLRQHPGSLSSFGGSFLGISSGPSAETFETVRVPASEILHCARILRVGQIRGEPRGVACMQDLETLRAYNLAELAAARANAARPVSIERSIDATAAWQGDQEGADKKIELDLSENGATVLPSGYRMAWSPVSHPPGNYAPFVSAITRQICADLQVTPHLVVEDFSQMNYVVTRAAQTAFLQHVRSEQVALSWMLLRPVFLAWLEYALMGQQLLPLRSSRLERYSEHQFIPGRVRSLDESRDISALKDAVTLNLMSLSEAVQSFSGRELDDVLAERVAEKAKLAAVGLPDPADVILAKTAPGQNSPEDELPDEGMKK